MASHVQEETNKGANASLESCLLSPPGVLFSISVQPLLMGSFSGNDKAGCVVSFMSEEDSSEPSTIFHRIQSELQIFVTEMPPKNLLKDLQRLLLGNTSDTFVQISNAMKALSGAQGRKLAGRDEVIWFRSPWLRSYALLRRLAMPMHHVVNSSSRSTLTTLEFSFLDLLLKLEGLKQTCGSSLVMRLKEMKIEVSKGANSRDPKEVKQLQKLGMLVKGALSKASFRAQIDHRDATKHFYPFTIPERLLRDHRVVDRERERLLKELDERRKNEEAEICHYAVGGKVKLPKRIWNGCLLITEAVLSHGVFCDQFKIMEKVNKTLPRPFYPATSRPKMQKVDMSTGALSQLRSIFFDNDGSLKTAIMEDVDLSSRHGYINFSNAMCRDDRNDYRWQVPIRRHSTRTVVATRSVVESFFSQQKIIHPGHETIHDMGVLIGGTEDQSLHHDISRQTTCWLPEDPDITEKSGVPVRGWEFDRAAYNEAMASAYAPSSVLFGMSESGVANLGVQKNQIERYGCEDGWCRIVDGKKGEQFRIVRENKWLAVLQASPGGMFTGDFQHAGVRNFPVGSEEDKIMMDFYGKIQAILEEGEEQEEEHSDITKDIITMMCNFPKLNKICRFHFSTEPTHGPLRIPRNAVGFVDCQPNRPDSRFDETKNDSNKISSPGVEEQDATICETRTSNSAQVPSLDTEMVNAEQLDEEEEEWSEGYDEIEM